MQRINFTETTLTTLTRNARCSFANAVYKLTMKAQQGLKCDDLFKKSVLMNEVNKLLCKYKLDECISFHPYQEAGISTWAFGVGDISPYIWEIYLTINDVVTLIGEGTDLAEIAIDINANTETTGVSAELSEDGDYMTVYSPPGCFVKGDLIKTSDRPGALPQSLITFLAGKCPQVETCVDYTEEELNCIAPQDLQLIFEFTHRYKETLAKSTKRVTSPSTSSSSSSASDCCNWGSIGGSIGNQSDLVAYLNTIKKNFISVYDETTEITGDLKSLKFLGAGVTATNSGGNVSVTIPGGGGGGSSYTVNNGLTEDPANNFKLGGTLIEDTTINQDGYLMRFGGSAAAKLDFLVTIDKAGGFGSGLFVNSDQAGVVIDSVSTGVEITSDSSPLAGNGTLGSTLTCTNNLSNSQVSILNLYKSINTTSAVNSGVFISMFPGTDSGGSNIQSSDISCLIVNATQPNVQSKLVLKPQGAGTVLYGSALETYGSGKLQLPAYGKTPANFSGTPAYSLGVDASGNVVEFVGGGGGGLTTADNGLTANTSTNVRLGGTLLANTTILNNGFDFVVSRTTTGGDAIKGVGTNGVGVRGQSTSQPAIIGISTSNSGVSGVSTTGEALTGTVNSTTTNDIKTILRLNNSNSSASIGTGAAIDFFAGTSSSSQVFAGQLAFFWEDITNATRKSSFVIKTVHNGISQDGLKLFSQGLLQLPNYGVNTFLGVPKYLLGVDSTGKVMEVPPTLTFKQVISSADIKNGTAVNLITAPGAGKAICITEASIQLTGTTAYAGATGVFALYNSTSGTLLKSMFNSGTNTFFQTNTGSTTELYKLIDTSTNAGNLSKNMVANEGVDAKVFWTIGPMSSGNVGVTVYGSYRIIDL